MSGPIDRADEFRDMPDLWPVIAAQVGSAFGDAYVSAELSMMCMSMQMLEEKFRRGEAEHGRDWLNMTRGQLHAEIEAELLDLVLYHAMARARWPRSAVITDRDPGDERD